MTVESELQFMYRGEGPPLVPVELAKLTLAGSERTQLVDTYYDTDDLRLRRAGCTLRIRQAVNRTRPRLTWKGSAVRRRGAKEREETEVPLEHLPRDGAELAEKLVELGLWDLVRKAMKRRKGGRLESIGEVRNDRSTHSYVRGLHRLELTWDRLDYPVGPPETRLEVEVKSRPARRFLKAVQAELDAIYGGALVSPPRGKVKELCDRLYPDVAGK